MSDSQPLVIGADIVVIAHDKVVSPGRVVIGDGKIIESREGGGDCDVNLAGCALLPGLINAHTHLEFSDLGSPLPAGGSFPEWIGRVVAHRRQQQSAGEEVYRQQRRRAIGKGAAELYRTGTALAADIVTEPWSCSDYRCEELELGDKAAAMLRRVEVSDVAEVRAKSRHLPPPFAKMIAMPEVIGLDVQRIGETITWAKQCVQDEVGEQLHSVGVSPHSPYSVLFDHVAELLKHESPETLVAMHLAESVEELEWLAHRSGAFQEAFERIGVTAPAHLPTIDNCLELLGAHRSLAVHGNYLTRRQMEVVASFPAMSVVYCPRTHGYFGHSEYPLREMLDLGVRVVLGTDSRASNPDLDLWEELRFARQQHSWLSATQALAMATGGAAEALGVSGQYGTLGVGGAAHVFATPLVAREPKGEFLDRLTSKNSGLPPLGSVSQLLGGLG